MEDSTSIWKIGLYDIYIYIYIDMKLDIETE